MLLQNSDSLASTDAQSLKDGLAQKSNIHILPQEPLTLSVFYPILATSNANGIKGLRKPSVDIIPSYVDKILRIKEQHASAKQEWAKVTVAKIQLLSDYSTIYQ